MAALTKCVASCVFPSKSIDHARTQDDERTDKLGLTTVEVIYKYGMD
jgi:hypothetical protein